MTYGRCHRPPLSVFEVWVGAFFVHLFLCPIVVCLCSGRAVSFPLLYFRKTKTQDTGKRKAVHQGFQGLSVSPPPPPHLLLPITFSTSFDP
jgi:hypothetical protein